MEPDRMSKKNQLLGPLKLVVVLVIMVLAFEVMVLLYPPIYVFYLALTGRSPICSSSQAIQGATRYQSFRKRDSVWKSRQLLKEDPRGFDLWQSTLGDFWVPKKTGDVLPILISQQETGIYGFDEQTSIHPGDIVLDCGAHVGVFTRTALNSGAKMVIAIEPAPENQECLRLNFAKEITRGRVVVYPKGVWDKEDVLTFYVYPQNSAADGFVIDNPQASPVVTNAPLTRIDMLVEELKLPEVNFIKLDVKGAARKALSGARQTLIRHKPKLVISVEEEPEGPAGIASFLQGLGLGYHQRCGMCAVMGGRVVPNELFYYP
jgi:FkbM family methyltransferase